MFNSEILEVAIGLIFVFLIGSLLASAVREMIESVLKTRAVQLEKGIRLLLDDPSGMAVTKEVFHHPLIYGLFAGSYQPDRQLTGYWNPFAALKHRQGYREPGVLAAAREHLSHVRYDAGRIMAEVGSMMGGKPAAPDGPMDAEAIARMSRKRLKMGSNLPAYIPARNFALALMHVVAGDADGVLTVDSLKANAMALPPGRVRDAVLAAVSEAGGDLDRARTSLEAWYDGNMDRVAGWYKRETQYVLFALGLLIAGALNIDSLSVVHDLATNNALRQQTLVQVEKALVDGSLDPANAAARRAADADAAAAGANAPPPGIFDTQMASVGAQLDKVRNLSELIGWGRFNRKVWNAYLKDPAGKAATDKLVRDANRAAAAAPSAPPTDPAAKATADKAAAAAEAALRDKAFTAYWWKAWRADLLGWTPGWLITAIAISLGAPFWFDLMNKFMIIRSTVKPYEKSPSEGSEDRKGGGAPSAVRLETSHPAVVINNSLQAGATDTAPPPDTIRIRLAVDHPEELTDLKLTRDAAAVEIPVTGFVEVELKLDASQTLEVTAKRHGRKVAWKQVFTPHLNNEGEPVLAALA